jgi:septal ring factor EnvC (AmiA/AmiB activator)
MAKALKPLIIVVLVLSLVSLILGIQLFSKREALKGRADKSAEAFAAIAQKLHFADFDAARLANYSEMDGELNKLATAADNTYEELQNRIADLEARTAERDQARTDLASTRKQLEQKEEEVTTLSQKMEVKDRELDEARGKNEQLEEEKQGLQAQINDLNDKIAQAEDNNRDLQDQIVTLEQTLQQIEGQLGDTAALGIPKGLSGKILVANRDWNFVILDLGSEDKLAPNAEMLVHRNDKLVGKIKISAVSKTLSIGEIVNDWEQTSLKEGDLVVY